MCFSKSYSEFVWYGHSLQFQSPSFVCSFICLKSSSFLLNILLHDLHSKICFAIGFECGPSLVKPLSFPLLRARASSMSTLLALSSLGSSFSVFKFWTSYWSSEAKLYTNGWLWVFALNLISYINVAKIVVLLLTWFKNKHKNCYSCQLSCFISLQYKYLFWGKRGVLGVVKEKKRVGTK